jgi:hypothetical protein
LARFSKNQYYLRLFNAFFVAFNLNIFDPTLIVNALTYEFQVLQRKQRPLIRLAGRLLRVLFRRSKKRLRLKGVHLQLKGRLTP